MTETSRLEFIFKHYTQSHMCMHTYTDMYLYHAFSYLTDFIRLNLLMNYITR